MQDIEQQRVFYQEDLFNPDSYGFSNSLFMESVPSDEQLRSVRIGNLYRAHIMVTRREYGFAPDLTYGTPAPEYPFLPDETHPSS